MQTIMAGTDTDAGKHPDRWVTVACHHDPVDAQLLRANLEAQGIRTFLADEHLVQTDRLIAIAIGGVKVQVQARDQALAAAVIADIAAGRLALDDSFDPGSPQD